MNNIATIIADLENMGFFDYVLPFFLIFTIAFAVLQKSKILGRDENQTKTFNAILALIIGLLVMRTPTIIQIIQRFLPNVSLIILSIIMFLLVLGVFLPEDWRGFTEGFRGFFMILAFVLVIVALTSDVFGLGFAMPYWLENLWEEIKYNGGWMWIIVILIFVSVAFGKRGERNPIKLFGKGLKELGRGLTP